MYVRYVTILYVCMYVCYAMLVCMRVRSVCMCVCRFFMHVCYECVYFSMLGYVMYVCMVCMYVRYLCIYVYMYVMYVCRLCCLCI